MNTANVIEVNQLSKKYRGFHLNVPKCAIPKGFATALIGENGAGKTTFLNILAGVRLDYKGSFRFLDLDGKDTDEIKKRVGYTGTNGFFLPNWTIRQVEEISSLLFEDFHPEKFRSLCTELQIGTGGNTKTIAGLSDGNRVKLMLALVLARDTDCLLLDEPASPLDPLMRAHLCHMIQDYIAAGNGERSVLFSTHNIADMENVTDYCIIMEHGTIVESGYVDDLKEKYIHIQGEPQDAEAAKQILYSFHDSQYGFDGICLAEHVDKLAGMDIHMDTPTLSQISVAVMQANTKLKFN